jgi:RNA polymerase sigma-70 factor (ECF subfamily)
LARPPENSQATFHTVFEAEFDYVCHALRRLGVRDADLEDVAQDVFLGLHRRFDEYDGNRPIRPWLVAFAFRAASNYRRGQRRRGEELGSEPGESPVDGRCTVEGAERSRLVQQVLDQIDLERSVVLVMFDMDGYTASEIAASFELPLNTVYSRIRLARRDFRTIGAHLFSQTGEEL